MSAEENKALARLWQTMWNENRPELADDCFAVDALAHGTAADGTTTVTSPYSPETMKRVLVSWRTAFPDYHCSIEDLVADGDRVVINLTATGTHTGVFRFLSWNIPATGKRFGIRQIIIYRVAGGKFVELWTTWERLELLEQLGVAPPLAVAGV